MTVHDLSSRIGSIMEVIKILSGRSTQRLVAAGCHTHLGAIPNGAIQGFRAGQVAILGDNIAGEIIWNAGARDGVDGKA